MTERQREKRDRDTERQTETDGDTEAQRDTERQTETKRQRETERDRQRDREEEAGHIVSHSRWLSCTISSIAKRSLNRDLGNSFNAVIKSDLWSDS